MSNPDSFIDEVTEELRREKLTRLFRRYGWIGGVVIAVVVGGTAYSQWQNAREMARAQSFGDAVIEALDTGSPEARREALAHVPASGVQQHILDLIRASDPDDDKSASLAALDAVIADKSLAPLYHDLAVLRYAALASEMPVAERRAKLETIAVVGRPYYILAAEQLAWLLVEEGKTTEAVAALNALITDQEATPSLRARASQIVLSLGGEVAVVANDGLGFDALGAE